MCILILLFFFRSLITFVSQLCWKRQSAPFYTISRTVLCFNQSCVVLVANLLITQIFNTKNFQIRGCWNLFVFSPNLTIQIFFLVNFSMFFSSFMFFFIILTIMQKVCLFIYHFLFLISTQILFNLFQF